MEENIKNFKDLLKELDCEDEASIKKSVYKGTDCGAWIDCTLTGVKMGSIVEGVDWGTETHTLKYPFTKDVFWAELTKIEEEVNEIWEETHGCEDCGEEDEETGYIHINPNCPTCKGKGTII